MPTEDGADESREVREARTLAERKLRTYGGLDAPTRRRRLSAFLLRRGYPYATVAHALKHALAGRGCRRPRFRIRNSKMKATLNRPSSTKLTTNH